MPEQHQHKNLKERAREELRALLVLSAYLFLFLGAFNTYRRLILAEYGIPYVHYGVTVIEALVLAKIILIGDAFKVDRFIRNKPRYVLAILKSILYGALVVVFELLERLVEGLIRGEDLWNIVQSLVKYGKYETLARLLVMTAAFLPLFVFLEVRRFLGPGRLKGILLSTEQSNPPENTQS